MSFWPCHLSTCFNVRNDNVYATRMERDRLETLDLDLAVVMRLMSRLSKHRTSSVL